MRDDEGPGPLTRESAAWAAKIPSGSPVRPLLNGRRCYR
jgi:hypothetical protein